jgi:hypothetical protein
VQSPDLLVKHGYFFFVFFYRRRFRIEGLSHLTSARLVGQERANIWKALGIQPSHVERTRSFVKKQNLKIEK